jgi:hypothetical protein
MLLANQKSYTTDASYTFYERRMRAGNLALLPLVLMKIYSITNIDIG